MGVAASALKGSVYAPVGNATHYHANYVVPYWAASMAKIREIGAHDFYRWPGSWRASTYFSQRYANIEPGEQLATTTLAAIAGLETFDTKAASQALAEGVKGFADGAISGPVLDQKPHTLIVTEHAPQLDPELNRAVILTADKVSGKLEPAPSRPNKN
jgi:hypothetical protein